MNAMELTLPVDDKTVARALEWLEATADRAGWPARTLFKLQLCLDETLTNVTMYGYDDAHRGTVQPQVRLKLRQKDGRLILGILDNGRPFDPTAQSPRDLDTSLDDARIGGHGLRLMLHYLESMRYERLGDWNCLELVAALDTP